MEYGMEYAMEYAMEYWISNISNVISNCLGLVSLASQSVYKVCICLGT